MKKVMLVNGSPHEKGCTYTALREMADALEAEGIGTHIYYIGTEGVKPCTGCRACYTLRRCAMDDRVNAFVEMMAEYDALVLGSPVHYGSASGAIVPFMDRVFYSAFIGRRDVFRHKPGVAVASARRAGTTAALDQLNKYFQISEMPIISGRYWNMVHGANPDEVRQDEEGMQNMRIIARNLAWHLKCREAAEAAGILPPPREKAVFTNFIR
ncbi:MAG: flavodoxin family protein [Akkermansia sp.]|nr:flavodoxin family protein [Akkermansia sp.]